MVIKNEKGKLGTGVQRIRNLDYQKTAFFMKTIVHFAVAWLVAKPFNRSEAKDDLVMIQILLLLKCKFPCYYAN